MAEGSQAVGLFVVAGADIRYVDSVLPIIPTLLPLRCASACAFTTTERALVICSGWLVARADVTRGPFQHGQRFFLLCRYEKAQGVNLELEFFVSTIKAMATISDLHEIYAFQFGFARLAREFVAFCCERDRVTDTSAQLSSRLKLLRITIQ